MVFARTLQHPGHNNPNISRDENKFSGVAAPVHLSRAGAGTGVEANEGAQDGNGDGGGDGAGTGTGTGVGTRRRTPDGNGDGNGDKSEDCSGDGNGDDDNGNENRIGEGRREAKKRKKPQNSLRRRAENGGDMSGKRKKCRKERVGSVAANPDNLGSNKEAGGGSTMCSGLK